MGALANSGLHSKSYFKYIDPVGYGLGSALGVIKPKQAAAAAPTAPASDTSAISAAALAEEELQRKARGRASTDLTGGGDPTKAPTAGKTLLG